MKSFIERMIEYTKYVALSGVPLSPEQFMFLCTLCSGKNIFEAAQLCIQKSPITYHSPVSRSLRLVNPMSVDFSNQDEVHLALLAECYFLVMAKEWIFNHLNCVPTECIFEEVHVGDVYDPSRECVVFGEPYVDDGLNFPYVIVTTH